MKDKHVSIPMTILSLAIGIIVIFPHYLAGAQLL